MKVKISIKPSEILKGMRRPKDIKESTDRKKPARLNKIKRCARMLGAVAISVLACIRPEIPCPWPSHAKCCPSCAQVKCCTACPPTAVPAEG